MLCYRYRVSHRRLPIAYILKVDILIILPYLSSLRISGMFFIFENRASFLGNPVVYPSSFSWQLSIFKVAKRDYPVALYIQGGQEGLPCGVSQQLLTLGRKIVIFHYDYMSLFSLVNVYCIICYMSIHERAGKYTVFIKYCVFSTILKYILGSG